MILWFLMKVFFKIVYWIIELIVNCIIFLVKAIFTVLKEIGKAIVNSISERREKRKIEQKVSNTLKLEPPNLSGQQKEGRLMYAIVRKEESGEWTQSILVADYDMARQMLKQERQKSRLPRMIKKVYV